MAMRLIGVMILSMMLVGCSTVRWVPGPNASPNLTFDQQDARCSMLARHGGSDYYISADATGGEIAGAALGHALAEADRTAQDYNDCMRASGWILAKAQQ
jgi:hypothetical protein